MDPVVVALGAIVAGLVGKAGERASERAVDGGEHVVRRLAGRLRRCFSDDDTAARALTLVEQAPDDPSLVRQLAEHIAQHATVDAGFRSDLEMLVREARREGVAIDAVQQTAWGERDVQIAGLSESRVSVSYGTPPPGHRTT